MQIVHQAEEHREERGGAGVGGQWDQWVDGKVSESGGGGGWAGGVCGATEAAVEVAGLDVWEHEGVEGTMSHSGSTESFVKEELFGSGDPRHWVGGSQDHDRSVKHSGDAATPPMTPAHSRDVLIGKVARFVQGPLSLAGSLAILVGPAARYCPPRHPHAF